MKQLPLFVDPLDIVPQRLSYAFQECVGHTYIGLTLTRPEMGMDGPGASFRTVDFFEKITTLDEAHRVAMRHIPSHVEKRRIGSSTPSYKLWYSHFTGKYRVQIHDNALQVHWQTHSHMEKEEKQFTHPLFKNSAEDITRYLPFLTKVIEPIPTEEAYQLARRALIHLVQMH